MNENGYSYTLLLEGERMKRDCRVAALPTLYVIGREGEVLHANRGHHSGFTERLAEIFRRELDVDR